MSTMSMFLKKVLFSPAPADTLNVKHMEIREGRLCTNRTVYNRELDSIYVQGTEIRLCKYYKGQHSGVVKMSDYILRKPGLL